MKKIFAVLMLAAMMFSVGCGNQAKDAAKDAQQKVEQTANEAKDKATEMKDDATKKAEEMKADAEKMAGDMKDAMTAGRTIALNGIMPGASLEDLKAQFGEATSTAGDVMTFANGLKVKFDDATKKVKEISTTDREFTTPEGMYVGADEYLLNDYCGPADAVRQLGGAQAVSGGAEYEYFSDDKKSSTIYTAENGVITKITCAVK